jgi:hypothetical protein
MALVHDVAESLVGDITPHCGVSDADKHAMEAEAVGRIQEMLGRETQAGETQSRPQSACRHRGRAHAAVQVCNQPGARPRPGRVLSACCPLVPG